MKRFSLSLLTVFIMLMGASHAMAHCEIPCGIYDDEMRIRMINEHITTIEKSMKEIERLKSGKSINQNQITRWIMNKEYHAGELQKIVSQYFMTQRIKIGASGNEKKLVLLHKMLVYAMNCKQTTDFSHVNNLRASLNEFKDLYFGHRHK